MFALRMIRGIGFQPAHVSRPPRQLRQLPREVIAPLLLGHTQTTQARRDRVFRLGRKFADFLLEFSNAFKPVRLIVLRQVPPGRIEAAVPARHFPSGQTFVDERRQPLDEPVVHLFDNRRTGQGIDPIADGPQGRQGHIDRAT